MTLEEKIDTLNRFLMDDKASLVDRCLVAAAAMRAATEDEREACAKVAEGIEAEARVARDEAAGRNRGQAEDYHDGRRCAAEDIAAAIQARGKK